MTGRKGSEERWYFCGSHRWAGVRQADNLLSALIHIDLCDTVSRARPACLWALKKHRHFLWRQYVLPQLSRLQTHANMINQRVASYQATCSARSVALPVFCSDKQVLIPKLRRSNPRHWQKYAQRKPELRPNPRSLLTARPASLPRHCNRCTFLLEHDGERLSLVSNIHSKQLPCR